MDISTETDVTKLKALAFDQIALLEQAQANIQALNARIGELSRPQPDEQKDAGEDDQVDAK